MLKRVINPKTKRREYALVSGKGRPLQYFGIRKPTDDEFKAAEGRVQHYANKGKG